MDFRQDILPLLREYKPYIFLIVALFFTRKLIIGIYKRRKGLKKRDNFITGINNLTMMIFGAWLFFFILHLLDITVKEFFYSITIIAAALAVVFKDYILNGLNGMILMFGDNYRIGDFIEVNGMKGQIEDLTLLNVKLKNDEDNVVIIPNNLMAASTTINYSQNPKHFSTLDFEIRTSQSLSYEALQESMQEVLNKHKNELREDSYALHVREYTDDLIHYRLRYGLKKYDHILSRQIKQEFYGKLLQALEKNKIKKD
jgi:small-conductance mechanosensitive channel